MMASERVEVRPEPLRWAITRSRKSTDDYETPQRLRRGSRFRPCAFR